MSKIVLIVTVEERPGAVGVWSVQTDAYPDRRFEGSELGPVVANAIVAAFQKKVFALVEENTRLSARLERELERL